MISSYLADDEGGDADELEIDQKHDSCWQEPVDGINREEKGLRKEPEASMGLNEPVGKGTSHPPRELGLSV